MEHLKGCSLAVIAVGAVIGLAFGNALLGIGAACVVIVGFLIVYGGEQ